VPVTTEMTEQLVAVINHDRMSREAQALNFVCGALVAHDAAEGKSPYTGLDVERVFAAVELLAERRELEVTPFVATWHPAVDVWDRASAPSFFDKNFSGEVGKAVSGPFDGKFERLISTLIDARTGQGSGAIYSRLADRMIGKLRGLLMPRSDQLEYLAPIIEASRGETGLTVATLNYDVALEHAADNGGVDAYTGIESWSTTRRWNWPPDGLRLLKLHGSIDWCWQYHEHTLGQLPRRTVERSPDLVEEKRAPALVFGAREKLRAAGPFLSLLGEFERLLEDADRLVVIGYSFRDGHVNEVIRRWTFEDVARTITIVDPHFPKPLDRSDFRSELFSYLNLRAFPNQPPPPPERVTLIEVSAAEALPTVLGS
jgi:hypothetical protein